MGVLNVTVHGSVRAMLTVRSFFLCSIAGPVGQSGGGGGGGGGGVVTIALAASEHILTPRLRDRRTMSDHLKSICLVTVV
jgi:hypothetical protein